MLLLAACADAQPKDLLLPEGKTSSLPWTVSDGAGFNWDIHNNGNVQHGTNYAYGNGMQLHAQGGRQFYVDNNTGLLSADGREIQLGPFACDRVRIWRRIYVDPKLGYARWIDIFENTDENEAVKIEVQYQSHLGNGIQQCLSTTSDGLPGAKDWGFVTDNRDGGNRPAILHIYASKRSKYRPEIQAQMNNNQIRYLASLEIPPKQSRALCFFEAQRNSFDEAVELMKIFRPERELAKIPKPLRDVIVNLSGELLLIGRLELPRSRADDVVILQDDSEVHGTIQNESFHLETSFGPLDLPADRVAGLAVLDPNDGYAQIALTDGQIVAGMLGKDGVKVRLTDAKELTLPLRRIATVGYKIAPAKPEEIPPAGAMLVFRSGQQLRFDPKALPLEFQTEYGPLPLKADDLCELKFADAGRLHQAAFRNGSVLTGLLQAEEVNAPLSLGPTLNVSRETLAGVFYSSPSEAGGPFRIQLRNGDVLLGNLVDANLPIQTELGKIDVQADRIRSMHRLGGAPGRVAVKLADDTTVSGTLDSPAIRVQIAPDVMIPVYPSHVVEVQHDPVKENQPAEPPTTNKAEEATPNDKPA